MISCSARLSLVLLLLIASAAQGQGYYNLDAGRPGRVEDAAPAPRYELDLQLLPVRFEQLAGGTRRWRTDQKASFGIAPFTELEMRAPILLIDSPTPGVPLTSGLGGVAVGALHAFGLETGRVPAIAVAGEWLLPVGSLAARVGSYSAKLIATKTFPLVRVHANVAYGSWSVRPAPLANAPACGDFIPAPGVPVPPGCLVELPDTPCDRLPSPATVRSTSVEPAARRSLACAAPAVRAAVPEQTTVGSRWMSGVGLDHAFALASTLLSADVVAERYIGLLPFTDWTGEIGVRHQWSPQVVLDVGVARHFTGALRANSATIGLSYDMPLSAAHEDR
jgi:hypothetical protein